MFVFATAADNKYFIPLVNLIYSISRHRDESEKIVVFDIGLKNWQANFLRNLRIQSVELRRPKINREFFEGYLQKENLSSFAWKPSVIEELSCETKQIVWMDAGTLLSCDSSNLHQLLVRNSGILLFKNYQHKNYSWTSDDCARVMQATNYELADFHIMANFFAVDLSHSIASEFINEWIKYAKVEQAIRGNKENHRHDQTILSILRSRLQIAAQDHQLTNIIFRKIEIKRYDGKRVFLSCRRQVHDWKSSFIFDSFLLRGSFVLYSIPLRIMQLIQLTKRSIRQSPMVTRFAPIEEGLN